MAEVAVSQQMFGDILSLVDPSLGTARVRMNKRSGRMPYIPTAEVRPAENKTASSGPARQSLSPFGLSTGRRPSNSVAARLAETENRTLRGGNLEKVGL